MTLITAHESTALRQPCVTAAAVVVAAAAAATAAVVIFLLLPLLFYVPVPVRTGPTNQ